MADRLSDIATVRDDNHIAGVPGLVTQVIVGGGRGALRQLVWGAPRGRATLSRPTDSAFRAWAGVLQAALVGLCLGAVGLVALEPGRAWRAALVLAVGAAGVLFVGVLVAAAVDATVPPPRRLMPPRPDDPLSRTSERTGLIPVADGVWVAQLPLVFHGLSMGTRMTVLDTGDGLIVHSPVEADLELVEAVAALGTVRWIVAPNPLHHLFVGAWADAFPDAAVLAAPGLATRRPDLAWTGTLAAPGDAPWSRDAVDVAVVGGVPWFSEVALLHRASGTLVVSDLLLNLGQDPDAFPAVQRWLLTLVGMDQRPTMPTEIKLSVDDPDALRAAIERILGWRFERIVLAHGPLIQQDAHAVLADAFAFVR